MRPIPKLLTLLLVLLLSFSLAACGEITVNDAVDILDAVGTISDSLLSTATPTAAPTVAPTVSPTPATTATPALTATATPTETPAPIDENGWYYSAEDVSLYLITYGRLPDNYITKSEARELGWEGGSVEEYLPGAAIGGDVFGNYEGNLPKVKGRTYYECDIDTDGYGSRGSRRLVYTLDGVIYYTKNHYGSFTLLYGEG